MYVEQTLNSLHTRKVSTQRDGMRLAALERQRATESERVSACECCQMLVTTSRERGQDHRAPAPAPASWPTVCLNCGHRAG